MPASLGLSLPYRAVPSPPAAGSACERNQFYYNKISARKVAAARLVYRVRSKHISAPPPSSLSTYSPPSPPSSLSSLPVTHTPRGPLSPAAAAFVCRRLQLNKLTFSGRDAP